MKSKSWKVIFVGVIASVIIISIKHLLLPSRGVFSFFISFIVALLIGLYLTNKIKSIEK